MGTQELQVLVVNYQCTGGTLIPEYTDRVIVKRYFKEMLIEAILLFNLNIWTPIILTKPRGPDKGL